MADTVEVAEIPACNFCQTDNRSTPAEVDGKTKFGPWAYMCGEHHELHGVGLGTGRGQRLTTSK